MTTKRDSKSKPKPDKRPKRSEKDLDVPEATKVKGGFTIKKTSDKSSPA